MIKKIAFLTILVAGFIVSACGKTEPSDVAIEYIKAVSEGDLAKAKEISTPTNNELKRVIATCEREKLKQTVDKALSESKKIFKRGHFLDKKDQKEFESKIQKLRGEYGYIIPREEKNKIAYPIILRKVKDEDLAVMIILIGSNNIEGMAQYALDMVYRDINKTKKYCALREIKDIKVIHTQKSKEGDKATVKVEVSFKDGTSQKYRVNLEEIEGKWKVTGGLFKG